MKLNRLPFYTILFLSLGLTSVAHSAPNQNTKITHALSQAGIGNIDEITDTGITGLLQVKFSTGEHLLISQNGRFVINGNTEKNPSFTKNFAKFAQLPTGTPIALDHKKALLDNLTALKNINHNTEFFHTSIDGLIWGITENGTPFLISDDGRFFVNGEITELKNGQIIGLDAQFESTKNQYVLANLDEKTLTIYPAKNQKAVVYVATDINCPYCKIFHGKIDEYNAKGITIKAIGYPIYDNSPKPMRQLWCESDNDKRAKLLSLAMKGIKPTGTCKDDKNPLDTNLSRIHPLMIMATPAIYRADGRLFEGDFRNDEFYEFLNLKN